jgi:hypothetical protein
MWCFGASTTVEMNQRRKWCDHAPCRSHHNRQRGAVLIAMICAPALIDVMMISYACDYNCQILWCNQMLVIAIVDFVLRHKSIWNELWFVLRRKLMLWCNQILVIAIVDFVLSPQVNMKMNDAILCLWSTLWKIVKLTGLSMILASYYGINLLKFARTMTAWAPYIWGDCTHCYVLRCLCENKTEIRVRLTSLNATPPK